jgi:hypothetical protein
MLDHSQNQCHLSELAIARSGLMKIVPIPLRSTNLTASSVEVISTRTGLPANVARSLSHPYY